jgi:beta-lactamase class A
MTVTRRAFAISAILTCAIAQSRHGAFAAESGADALTARFVAIEKDTGGRLGVAGIDTGTGRSFGHRARERFAMCSTFKVLAASALLARVDRGKAHLDRRIRFAASDVINNSPLTKDHIGDGMTLAELCAAALDYSDNAAANLLLATLGGPHAVTAFARSLGDHVTRLDRNEPSLNEATPGDPRDTTTPAAIAGDLQKLLLGTALTPASRKRLASWLIANKTGDARLRAGLPRGWRVGDKTGSGDHGTANDIAIAWPPGRKPIVVAVYLTETAIPPDRQNAAIAEVARAVSAMVARDPR